MSIYLDIGRDSVVQFSALCSGQMMLYLRHALQVFQAPSRLRAHRNRFSHCHGTGGFLKKTIGKEKQPKSAEQYQRDPPVKKNITMISEVVSSPSQTIMITRVATFSRFCITFVVTK